MAHQDSRININHIILLSLKFMLWSFSICLRGGYSLSASVMVAQFVHARNEDSRGCGCSPEDQLRPAPRQQELAAEASARSLPRHKEIVSACGSRVTVFPASPICRLHSVSMYRVMQLPVH